MQEEPHLTSKPAGTDPRRPRDGLGPGVPPPEKGGLPAVVSTPPAPAPRRKLRPLLVLLAVLLGAAGGGWWWTHRLPPIPPWIAYSNGRLEADEVDISTKFP